MGDKRRFDVFAGLIARNFPGQEQRIADVAGGKGHLQLALMERGFHRVTTYDRRHRRASRRLLYRYGRFDYRSASRDFDLVVGMHPDEATDHVVMYATKHRVPFVVCPCCALPSAAPFEAVGYAGWIAHLTRLAEHERFDVQTISLPMTGRNIALIGKPA